MARIAFVVAMLLATGTAAPAQMPAGPSSLQETYGDWTVACITQEAVRRCAMGQRLLQPDGRQVAAIEFSLADEGMSGLLVLPFGLALERGWLLPSMARRLHRHDSVHAFPGAALLRWASCPMRRHASMLERISRSKRLQTTAVTACASPFRLPVSPRRSKD